VNNKAKLYLIPNSLGNANPASFLPQEVIDQALSLRHFCVEKNAAAAALLKSIGANLSTGEFVFYPLDKRSPHEDLFEYLKLLKSGTSLGIISEAGLPCIADPGQQLVKLAHENNIDVIPFVGPSSIFLALMASGFNGQQFRFLGYLPIQEKEKIKKIRELEKNASFSGETQIFIETPFRNSNMLKDLLYNLNPDTQLCIACDISLPTEFIKTKSIAEWRKAVPSINKKPTVFLVS
jgi:16S rRNA (cytidine1402-2'-O)-methyltransferase